MKKINTINLVYAISFLDLLAVGLTFPLLSNHLKDLGASHTIIGLSSSIYHAIQLFSGPLIGAWSDVKDRKTVLKFTLLLCSISYGTLGLTTSIYFILALRFVMGFAKHTQSICKAVISDLIPQKEQSKAYGRSTALSSLGFIIGPFIGGHLSEIQNGFTYVSGITSISFLINAGLVTLLPDIPKVKKQQTNHSSVIVRIKLEFLKTVKELRDLNWKVHWDTFLFRFLFGLSVTCYFSNQTLYLKEKYELSQKHIGYFISFFSTIGMFSAFFLDQINNIYKDSNSYKKLFHFSTILFACFVGIATSSNLSILIILIIPFSITATAIRVISLELMLRKCDELHKGSLSGASNSIMSLARFVSPFVTGIFSDIFSEESVMFVGAFPCLLCIILSLYMRNFVQTKLNKLINK